VALPSGASLGPQALLMLAGPHPRSLSLGGATSWRFPPAPRSGRRRFDILRGDERRRSGDQAEGRQ